MGGLLKKGLLSTKWLRLIFVLSRKEVGFD
jgi:hypothetical protein